MVVLVVENRAQNDDNDTIRVKVTTNLFVTSLLLRWRSVDALRIYSAEWLEREAGAGCAEARSRQAAVDAAWLG